jgi:hypothetical protein
MILTHDWRMCCDIYIYNIDVIIEFMWQGLEMAERLAIINFRRNKYYKEQISLKWNKYYMKYFLIQK